MKNLRSLLAELTTSLYFLTCYGNESVIRRVRLLLVVVLPSLNAPDVG
jgi:hypothetical protein